MKKTLVGFATALMVTSFYGMASYDPVMRSTATGSLTITEGKHVHASLTSGNSYPYGTTGVQSVATLTVDTRGFTGQIDVKSLYLNDNNHWAASGPSKIQLHNIQGNIGVCSGGTQESEPKWSNAGERDTGETVYCDVGHTKLVLPLVADLKGNEEPGVYEIKLQAQEWIS
ncbi:hypothetical protein FBG30_005124 [Escherichia coli]|nr:hypothetical protein [Escherichia coli]